MFAELFEGQIHVTEEFVLLLLAVFEIVQAAACAEQDALAAQRPQRFFHKAEIIYEKLAAVHRNARKAVIGAEMADGELAPGALVPVKREQACAVVVGNVERVEHLPVGDERIQFLIPGERGEETVIRFVDPLRVFAEQEVDEPLVGGDRCRERHGVVDLQIDDGPQRFQCERHLAVGRRHGKGFAEIDAGGRFDCGRRRGAVLVRDLEDGSVICLRGGQDRAGKAEEREVVHAQLLAQGVQRQRRHGRVCLFRAAAHIGKQLRDGEGGGRFRLRLGRRLRKGCKEIRQPVVFLRLRSGLLFRHVLAPGAGRKIGQVLFAQAVGRVDVRIKDVAEAPVLAGKEPHQVADVSGELQIDARKQIIGVFAVACKREISRFGGKSGGKVHRSPPSGFGL